MTTSKFPEIIVKIETTKNTEMDQLVISTEIVVENWKKTDSEKLSY